MAAKFWVLGTGNWSDTSHWALSSGGSGGNPAPTGSDSITFDGNSGGGTCTVDVNVNVLGPMVCGAFTGIIDFSAHNPTVSLTTFSGSGTGTRTINGGTGQWTMAGQLSQNSIDFSTTTNLTANFSSTPIAFAPALTPVGQRAFQTGGLSFGAITIGDSFGTGFSFQIAGAGFTFASLSISNAMRVKFSNSGTITAAPTWTGSSSGLISVSGDTTLPVLTITSGTASLSWTVLALLSFSSGAHVAANSYSEGGLTNITVTNPATGGGARMISG